MSPAPHPSSTTDRPGIQRTVSSRGGTQVIGQRVQVGLRYLAVSSPSRSTRPPCGPYDARDQLLKTVPRTSRKEVTRHKAYGLTTNRKIG